MLEFAAIGDEHPLWRQEAAHRRQRAARGVVQDEVVALAPPGEVLLRVVDDVIGADGADQLQLARAAHAGDFRAGRPGDLDGERADAAARSHDQDLLTRGYLAVVPDRLERRQARHRHGRGLLEGDVGRLRREVLLRGRSVFGESANAAAEDLVARREARDLRTHGLDDPGDVGSANAVLGPAHPEHEPDEIWNAGHGGPIGRIEAGRSNAQQNLVLLDGRLLDVRESENGGVAVSVLDDCLHGLLSIEAGRVAGRRTSGPWGPCRWARPTPWRCAFRCRSR